MLGNLVWLFVFIGLTCMAASWLTARIRLGFVIASCVCFLVATVLHVVVMTGTP